MAIGTPVIATRKGAEGLDIRDGHNILIADSSQEFASAIVRLLGDPQLREGLSRGGRELVQRRYSWEQSALQLEGLLEAASRRKGPDL
jgi:glycosyltransferase involved in cell wall biosynthesis